MNSIHFTDLDAQFDLVMIAEKFDESLLLLQSLLCWKVQDITYLKLNERVSKAKNRITDKTRSILKSWLWADYMLYDHFKKKMDETLIELYQRDLKSRLISFRAINKNIHSECVKVQGDNKFLHGKYKMILPIVLGYVIDETKPGCDLYAISEPNFSKMIHERQSTTALIKSSKP